MISSFLLTIENEEDRQFMADLFEQYHRLMYHRIKKITDDPWAIEDIMQTTLEKLIDKINVLRKLDNTHRAAYIATATKNTAYNHFRNAKQFVYFEDDTSIQVTPYLLENETEQFVLHQEKLHILHQVWSQLDRRSRYLLESRYILEKSFHEIAADLNIKPDSVRMALTRARKAAISLIESYDK